MKVMIKHLTIPPEDQLRVLKASLDGWGIRTSFQGDGQVLIKQADLARLVIAIHEQHSHIHLAREHLAQVSPIVTLDRALADICEDHHKHFPSTEETYKITNEVTERAVQQLKTELAAETLLNNADPAGFQKE
jgi:hypothetical protein